MKKTTFTLSQTQLAYIQAIRPFAARSTATVSLTASYSFGDLLRWSNAAGYTAVAMWAMTADRKVGRGRYALPELAAADSDITVNAVKRGRPASPKSAKPAKAFRSAVRSSPMVEAAIAAALPADAAVATADAQACMVRAMTQGESDTFVPDRDPNYVAWGYYSELERIIKSKTFCPVFITGMSGNGKTTMIEQIASKLKRECIRVNFTVQTDEDELLGGFRLIGGETKFVAGPVLVAMQRGAILLLDEVDLGSHAIMCLQAVLEGKGKYIPKTGQYVRPAAGFTIIATANTKGKGSADGRFAGTNQLNEAFLDRFHFTYEQDYASPAVEKKILAKYGESLGVTDEAFITNLVNWADIIRKSFKQQIVSEIITTRRLRDVMFAFSVFGDKMLSIERCVSRFDEDTKRSFMEFYTKIDATATAPVEVPQTPADSKECPF